jgi:hypothetical protein
MLSCDVAGLKEQKIYALHSSLGNERLMQTCLEEFLEFSFAGRRKDEDPQEEMKLLLLQMEHKKKSKHYPTRKMDSEDAC